MRNKRIKFRVSQQEKAAIKTNANRLNISISRMLRYVGTRAHHIKTTIGGLRHALSKLYRLKRSEVSSEEIQTIVDEVVQQLEKAEKALTDTD